MSDPASSAASAVFTQMQQNTMDPSLLPPPITSSGLSNEFSKNHGSTTEQSHGGNQIGESNATEPVQIDNSMNPYISLPFSELESILSRLTESTAYANSLQQTAVAAYKSYSEHEKNENDFMRVLEATLNREIETRDKLKAEIQSCKDVVRNFLASIEI